MTKVWEVKDSRVPGWGKQGDNAPAYVIDRSYRDSTDLSQNEFYTWLKVKNSGGTKCLRTATRLS